MKKISAIIVALVTVLIVFAIIGSIVFVYPIVAGQQLTLPSDQNVHYKQGWKQYTFLWVSQNSAEYLSIRGQFEVYPDNFTPTTYYPGSDNGGGDFLTPTQGATYDLSGFGLRITIISGVNSDNLVISVHSSSTSFWQTTTIITLTVIAILLAVIIGLLLLRKRKPIRLRQ